MKVISIKFPKRTEIPKRYDTNAKINKMIAAAFKESISSFVVAQMSDDYLPTIDEILSIDEYGDMLYSKGKTLRESGSAVFCMEHGLRIRGIKITMQDLAKELDTKDYYCLGKGTYHNLFDHYGLRRATNVDEIFETLNMGKIVTLLKRDNVSLFVNLVGKLGKDFIVDDPRHGRIVVDIQTILQETTIAWLW